MPETRAEHLQWAKDRALEYLKQPEAVSVESAGHGSYGGRRYLDVQGHEIPRQVSEQQLRDAVASFISDLGKHHELQSHPALMFIGFEMMRPSFWQADEVRHFIEGTN